MKPSTKKVNSMLVGISIFSASIFSGCDNPKQKVERAREDVSAAEEDLSQARTDYKNEMASFRKESGERIAANEKIIRQLSAQMENDKKDVKASYKKQIEDLRQKNAAMEKRMEDYKDSDLAKWQSFKREFAHDMEELEKSLQDFTVDNKK